MEVVPDFSTVWLFRERLIKSGKYGDLWKELQRQMDEKGFKVVEGTIQDATFITSDPGRKRKKDDKNSDSEDKKEDQDSGEIEAVQKLEFDKDIQIFQIILPKKNQNRRDLVKS